MLRRDSPTPREHMSERLWMRNRMTLLHSVCHHHEFVKTSHRGSHETCSPQVLTEPSIERKSRLIDGHIENLPCKGFSQIMRRLDNIDLRLLRVFVTLA